VIFGRNATTIVDDGLQTAGIAPGDPEKTLEGLPHPPASSSMWGASFNLTSGPQQFWKIPVFRRRWPTIFVGLRLGHHLRVDQPIVGRRVS